MDIALGLDPTGTVVDLVLQNYDLALDGTLQTAVLISFFTNRLAAADDVIPDGSADRQGWWGDAYLPPLPDGSADFIGSKLWLYARCNATQENANGIRDALSDSLKWMTATGLANSVSVSTQWVSATGLQINTTIVQRGPAGTPVKTTFQALWDKTLGAMTSWASNLL